MTSYSRPIIDLLNDLNSVIFVIDGERVWFEEIECNLNHIILTYSNFAILEYEINIIEGYGIC